MVFVDCHEQSTNTYATLMPTNPLISGVSRSQNVCDEDGRVIEGYQSGVLFGDSINRKVAFEKELNELNGRAVRLTFKLKDCHLYSFKFNNQ